MSSLTRGEARMPGNCVKFSLVLMDMVKLTKPMSSLITLIVLPTLGSGVNTSDSMGMGGGALCVPIYSLRIGAVSTWPPQVQILSGCCSIPCFKYGAGKFPVKRKPVWGIFKLGRLCCDLSTACLIDSWHWLGLSKGSWPAPYINGESYSLQNAGSGRFIRALVPPMVVNGLQISCLIWRVATLSVYVCLVLKV